MDLLRRSARCSNALRRSFPGAGWPVSRWCVLIAPPLSSPQDLCQALESLAGALAALSACAQKVAGRDCCAQEAAALQQSYEGLRGRVKDRQAALEQLLAHWQRWAAFLSSWRPGWKATLI